MMVVMMMETMIMMTLSMSIVIIMVQPFVYNKLLRFQSEQRFVSHLLCAVVALSDCAATVEGSDDIDDDDDDVGDDVDDERIVY